MQFNLDLESRERPWAYRWFMADEDGSLDRAPTRSWTFLTNHAHVLLAIAATPDLRLRDIADLVGVTERTTSQIIDDLERDGYLRRERHGRRNRYVVEVNAPLRHPLEEHHQISRLLDALEHEPHGTRAVGSTGS